MDDHSVRLKTKEPKRLRKRHFTEGIRPEGEDSGVSFSLNAFDSSTSENITPTLSVPKDDVLVSWTLIKKIIKIYIKHSLS